MPDKRDLIYSVVYTIWFLIICFIFRGDDNLSYAYIAAWCSGLWISAILRIRLKSIPLSFLLLLTIYLIDGFGKFFIFTSSKQTEDFVIVIFAAVGVLPIIINHFAQNIFAVYSNRE